MGIKEDLEKIKAGEQVKIDEKTLKTYVSENVNSENSNIRYKALKRVTKNFDTKFSRERETDEIEITIGDITLNITEQQYGVKTPPYVYLTTKDCTYQMSFETFIKNAIS